MPNYVFDPTQPAPIQAGELQRIGSPKHDDFLLKVGRYIAGGINYAYQEHCPQEVAIREIIDYDAITVDTSRFPLLKLYRQSDNFLEGAITQDTKGVIAYCLTFPQQDRLPGLLRWMSKAINQLLDSYAHKHDFCRQNVIIEDRTAEYRIMASELSSAIHPFLRFNFSFREQ